MVINKKMIMKLNFSIDYTTVWGECLHVVITYIGRDGSRRCSDLAMQTDDGQHWTLETVAIQSRHHPVAFFQYIYKVEDETGKTLRAEWDGVPRIFSFDTTMDYLMPDTWREYPLQSHLFTQAYQATRHLPVSEALSPLAVPLFRRTLLFRISAPQLSQGQSVAVCGSHPALGSWSASRYLKMQYEGRQEWILSVNVDGMLQTPLEYKYVIVDDATHAVVQWEEGDNRSSATHTVGEGQVLVLDGGFLRVCETMWKAAGVAVPVFSLRSEHSYGVGDFGDLRRLVDWCVATGMRIIQLLPVCDTTMQHSWMDSSPYRAVSVYALHPHYIDLEAAGVLNRADRMTAYHRQRQELNALSCSDYEAVDRVKMAYLRELYAEQGAAVCASSDYQAFVERQKEWLLPYAAFCLLRDHYHTACFTDWGPYAQYDEKLVADFCAEHADEVNYIGYIQYLLEKQLRAASSYAHEHGVALMGDVPAGICRDSVEAWTTPQYFHLDVQTGTPPDVFRPDGQNWELPAYDWEAMMADDCRWWHDRMDRMALFFDAVRLDHVLGFFRIWEIPADAVYGQLGHFSPSLPFTAEEIASFGLTFRHDMLTRPLINDRVVTRLFGIHAQYVRDHFLDAHAYGLYDLKPEWNTQRKIQAYFEGRRDENSLWIRDGLYRLVANVLLVEDNRHPGMYHPRVNAFREPVFEVLDDEDKEAYMRLYNHYFFHRHNLFWGHGAMRRLTAALHGCRMLVCGEDLGLLPDCVEPVLDSLRILTTELQTLPKQDGYEFAHLGNYPYRSMATTSTHDTAPLRLWWEENPERVQRFFVTMLQKEGRAPRHLPAYLAEEIIARHLYCPSMLCVLPLQDWLALAGEPAGFDIRQERVNTPSDAYNRWQYRMGPTIERLTQETQLNRKLKTMITRSKR